jgi:hypothetical protein
MAGKARDCRPVSGADAVRGSSSSGLQHIQNMLTARLEN